MPVLGRRTATPLKSAAAPRAPLSTPFQESQKKFDTFYERPIDKMQLDEEWVQHPEKVRHVGDHAALAMSYRDLAESEYELAKAEADGRVREQYVGAKDKATEARVKAAVAQDERVMAAEKVYLDWKLLAARWGKLEKAYDARQYALRNLVNLWEKDYFSSNIGSAERGRATDRVAAGIRRQGT